MGEKLDDLIKQVNKQYKTTLISEGMPDDNVERIPFSSPRLNYMLYGGIPQGRLIEFFGSEGGGKTTSALDIVKNAQQMFPEKRVLYIDCERTLDTEWAKLLGVNIDELILFRPETETAEQIFEVALKFMDSGEISLCILDSIGVMVSAQAYEKTMEERTYGGISQALTLFSRKAVPICARNHCTLIGINQMRDDMGSMYGGETTTGGKAWRHNCFGGNTLFVTDKGLRRFRDCKDGEQVTVVDMYGELRTATVRCYGKQPLQQVVLRTPNSKHTVVCTPNHRWILADGTVTENLSIGDSLYYRDENINHPIMTQRQAEMFCLGFAIGDGCDYKNVNKNNTSVGVRVVLCGAKEKYKDIFKMANYNFTHQGKYIGFQKLGISKQDFLNGSCWKYLSAEDKRYLFMGYYSADGSVNNSKNCVTYDTRVLNFIKDTSSLAGYFVTSITPCTSKEGSFVKNKLYYRVCFTTHTNKFNHWTVESIRMTDSNCVYCVEEPITHSFTLEKGIVTGNCSLRVQFKKGDYIDDKNSTLTRACENPAGNLVQCSIIKSKVCRSDRRTGFYTLKYLDGIDYISDTIDVAQKLNMIVQSGAWYSIVDTDTGELIEKFQGKDKVKQYYKENQDRYLDLISKISKKIF